MPLLDAFADNPMFTAGAGLVGMGAGLALLRQGSRQAYTIARRQLLTTLEIPSHDKSYYWVHS